MQEAKSSLFDCQVNGFAGVDFQSPELDSTSLRRAVLALRDKHETHRIFLTLITDRIDALCHKLENIERIRMGDPEVAEVVCGYHLEGPWLSSDPSFSGAHDPQLMVRPSPTDFHRLMEAANGRIRLITLAPEVEDACEIIKLGVDAGVAISLGHTNASDEQIDGAIAAGARFCTHLGNGVPVTLHRHENIIQRLLARDELTAFFIADGIHIPPGVLRSYFRAKPAGRAFFTTDCMAAAGAPPGRYSLLHNEMEVGGDRIVRVPGKLNFAGSSLSPNEGVFNLQRWLSLEEHTARSLFGSGAASQFGIQAPTITITTTEK